MHITLKHTHFCNIWVYNIQVQLIIITPKGKNYFQIVDGVSSGVSADVAVIGKS